MSTERPPKERVTLTLSEMELNLHTVETTGLTEVPTSAAGPPPLNLALTPARASLVPDLPTESAVRSSPPRFSNFPPGPPRVEALRPARERGPLPVPGRPRPERDPGAAAAQRTVRAHRTAPARLPLVGETEAADRRRIAMLEQAAADAAPEASAKAYVLAALTAERLGDIPRARELFERAGKRDPGRLDARAGLRRCAIHAGDWEAADDLLTAEAEAGLAETKAALLLMQARLRWAKLGARKAALISAQAAGAVAPSAGTAWWTALFGHAHHDRAATSAALAKLAQTTTDSDVQAGAWTALAHWAEEVGDTRTSAQSFLFALASDPALLAARLGAARTSADLGQYDQSAEHLSEVLARWTPGPTRDALERACAEMELRAGHDTSRVLQRLQGLDGIHARRLQVEAAAALADPESLAEAWTKLAEQLEGTERAYAQVSLAEAQLNIGAKDAAIAALEEAQSADGMNEALRVLSERRATQGSEQLPEALDPERQLDPNRSALAQAAHAPVEPTEGRDELALLEQARHEAESALTAEVLLLDLHLGAKKYGPVKALLQSIGAHGKRDSTAAEWAALANMDSLNMSPTERLAAALAAVESAPEASPAIHTLLRHLPSEESERHGNLWLTLAHGADGPASAFAAVNAARALGVSSPRGVEALQLANVKCPGYPTAVWFLEPELRRRADVPALAKLHQTIAETSVDTFEIASRHVRLGLLASTFDKDEAREHLGRAALLYPDDMLIADLIERVGGVLEPDYWQRQLAQATEAPDEIYRLWGLSAGRALEAQGHARGVLELYRAMQNRLPSDARIAHARLRLEEALGNYPAVSDALLSDLRSAPDDRAKARVLETLGDFDRRVRNDPTSAALSYQALLELEPNNLRALYALERHYATHQRDDALLHISLELSNVLEDQADRAAYARYACYLARALGRDDVNESRALFHRLLSDECSDPWALEHALGVATVDVPDRLLEAEAARGLARVAAEPLERAALALRHVEAAAVVHGAEFALASLNEILPEPDTTEHPLIAEARGRLLVTLGRFSDAADAFEQAALQALAPSRQAALWYIAGGLQDEQVGNPERALAAYLNAAAREPALYDVFDRAVRILRETGDTDREVALTQTRIAVGASPPELAALHLRLSELYRLRGEPAAAREAVKQAATLAPDSPEALRALAAEHMAASEWRSAADALIRLCHRVTGPEETEVFFSLGALYEDRLADIKRAEGAYLRVAALDPAHRAAVERLAGLYLATSAFGQAADVLERLVRWPDSASPQLLQHVIDLSRSYEALGDARHAEQVLDDARRRFPTDLRLIAGQAALYQRQGASAALRMHYNRAASDSRDHLAAHPEDLPSWRTFVQVLTARGQSDPARWAANTATALGHVDVELGRLAVGAPSEEAIDIVAGGELDEFVLAGLISPELLSALRDAREAIHGAVPVVPKNFDAERLSGRKHDIVAELQGLARHFGYSSIDIYAAAEPRLALITESDRPSIILGRDLLSSLTQPERRFVLLHLLKLARSGVAELAAMKARQLHLVLAALRRASGDDSRHGDVDTELMDEFARRISKHLSRKHRPTLRAQLGIFVRDPSATAESLLMKLNAYASRAAFAALAHPEPAITALLKLHGAPAATDLSPLGQLSALKSGHAELADLIRYTVSESYFEFARRRALLRSVG